MRQAVEQRDPENTAVVNLREDGLQPDVAALAEDLAVDLDGTFERFVVCYQDRLYRFSLRLTGSPLDAEEIAQDAFIRAYRALSSYPPARVRTLSLRPWLYQITLNVTRNRARGRRLQVVPLSDKDHDVNGFEEPAGHERDQPEAVVEKAERGDELADLVAALPARYRAAVVLRHIEGLSYSELADVLDQPIGTVKANVHRGVRQLREALSKQLKEADSSADSSGRHP